MAIVSVEIAVIPVAVVSAVPPVEPPVEAMMIPPIGERAIPEMPGAVSVVEAVMQRAVAAMAVVTAVVVVAVVTPVPTVVLIAARGSAAAYQQPQTQRGGRSRKR